MQTSYQFQDAEDSSLWQQILAFSETMNNLYIRNDWSQLNTVIESRQQLLDRFFAAPLEHRSQQELKAIEQNVRWIQQQDEKLLLQSEETKSSMLKSLNKIKHGKNLNKLYQN